jgi:hypothetical protein
MKPTKTEAGNGWEADKLETYVAERNRVAAARIFRGMDHGRVTTVEHGPGPFGWAGGGYSPLAWLRKHHS